MSDYIFLNPVKSFASRRSRCAAISLGVRVSKLAMLAKNL